MAVLQPSLRQFGEGLGEGAVAEAREALQRAMTLEAGVLRSHGSLERVRVTITAAAEVAVEAPDDHRSAELCNLATVADAMVSSAIARQESRGAHTRTDFPDRDDDHFHLRFVHGGPSRKDDAP